MDPKFDIAHSHTIAHKLHHKMVLLPSQLTPPQIARTLLNIFQLEVGALKGSPLSTTLYKFAYLYDPLITAEDILMNALTQSIQTLGNHIYDIMKQSCSVKEDDVNISIFSFSKQTKTHDEVVDLIIQAEKKV